MGAETANTTVTLLRGTSENQFGDLIDALDPVMTGLPATLAETGKTVQDPTSTTPRTIRQVYCSVPQYAGLVNTDRLLDESTGETYIVIDVTTPPTIIGAPVDTVATLKRITASTT